MKARPDSTLRQLADALDSGSRAVASGLSGSALAYVLATLLKQREGVHLIVAPTTEKAEELISDLKFFLESTSPPDHPNILHYPAWDVAPYDVLYPHASIAVQRIEALYAMRKSGPGAIIVSPAEALLKQVIPIDVLNEHTYSLAVGEETDRETLTHRLAECGYLSTDLVEDAGCFAIRGGLLDLFPPFYPSPVRIEFFGDTVESIRSFDPISQRSTRSLDNLTILPVREEILTTEMIAGVSSRLKTLGDTLGCPSHIRRQCVEDMNLGIYFPGIEYTLGVLYGRPSRVVDYLPMEGGRIILIEPEQIRSTLQTYHSELLARFSALDQRERLVPPPETLFIKPEELERDLEDRACLSASAAPNLIGAGDKQIRFKVEPTSGLRELLLAELERGEMLRPLVNRLEIWKKDHSVSIVCSSTTQANRLRDLLVPYGIALDTPTGVLPQTEGERRLEFSENQPRILLGQLSSGFHFREEEQVFLSESDIFGKKTKAPTVARNFLKNAVSSFSQLNRGDVVIHAIHGVGIFKGLKKLDVSGVTNDFLQIEYLGGDRLYVPVHRLNELNRHNGAEGSPQLDKLGGLTFAKTKSKVKRSILKMAHELLRLYASRATAPGFAFDPCRQEMAEFEATFPFEETADQEAAIEAVLKDMAAERPMDRLICGDVGYGKTEVALRASYLAVLNNKQVAVLVPTTVLALQHYRSFQERFKQYPIRVEMLNRFRSAAAQHKILEDLHDGKVDIVVGTHRLLSTDVVYKDLGLLVVDEEHRFGVTHKERLKKLKTQVDVLTLTATPIPRTLHMAMSGLREFSLIATPPKDRRAIRTYHTQFSRTKIQEAIRFELKRGGQVYFVHNRVNSILSIAQTLHELVPEASIGVAHGQMSERALEKVMVDFIERKYHVLCCTAIIESGLDIPPANTIIINRSDQFGLAQLYQLRGRVGRSSNRAYAYLLTPAGRTLPPATERRLRTLVSFTELGAGFKVAREDLELRGAGDLLGPHQSGHINAVGLDMYCQLMEEAIRESSGQEGVARIEPEIDLKIPAFFPEEYVPDLHTRLHYYKQLSDANDEHILIERMEEIEDRFGPYPGPVKNLMDLMHIKVTLSGLRVLNLTYQSGKLTFVFHDSTPIDRTRIAALVSSNTQRYQLTHSQQLIVKLSAEECQNLAVSVKNFLHKLN